jgi:hypothetical protein
LRAAQADAALAPEADVRRQVGLDALARREVQARIELADDDLDASRGRRRRLVEGERADLVDEAGGQRRRGSSALAGSAATSRPQTTRKPHARRRGATRASGASRAIDSMAPL